MVGVGAQKSATSSIYRFLCQNGATSPRGKELHAFNRFGFTSRKTYLKLLGYRQDEKTYVEFTPNYLSAPTSIWNLSKVVPEARVIVSLRDPIERLISSFHHGVGISRLDARVSLEELIHEALRGTKSGWAQQLLPMGLYGQQLVRLLAHFPRDQVHIVNFRDFIGSSNGDTVRSSLLGFCGLPDNSVHKIPLVNTRDRWKRKDKVANALLSKETTKRLVDFYMDSNQVTEQIVGRPLNWEHF